MSLRTVTMYEVVCDWPSCEIRTADLGGEFAAFGDHGAATDDWIGSDGIADDGDRHYCYEHAIMACEIGSCEDEVTHRPCCSSHTMAACCACYRRTHFVEVGPCCSAWTAASAS